MTATAVNRLTRALAHEFQMIRAAVTMPGAGGAVYHAILPMNRCLTVGDCITSANGMFHARLEEDGKLRVHHGAPGEAHGAALWESARPVDTGPFFALVQSDGNFCIYRGTDLAHNLGWHWGTQLTAAGGAFHARLKDDGEFCICKGSCSTDPEDLVWRSQARDPVARIDRIDAIDYKLSSARVLSARATDLYRETVHNSNQHTQSSQIRGTVSVADSAQWADDLAAGVGAPAAEPAPVPVMLGGQVRLSSDASHAFVRNGTSASNHHWSFDAPAAVPPHSSMLCSVAAQRSTIVVPYTLRGVFTLASGAQVAGSVDGNYTGSNCHDLSVVLSTVAADRHASPIFSQPLTPHSA